MIRPRSPRSLGALLAGAFTLALASCGAAPEPAGPPPDVFLIVVDTLRKDRLGCYGYERPLSPRIDQMAAEGALFLDPNAQASWTRPSMLSLFTGRYVTAFRDTVPEDRPTMAELFERAGYATFGVVGNVIVSEEAGFARGFEHFDARRATKEDKLKIELGRDAPALMRDYWGALDDALERAAAKVAASGPDPADGGGTDGDARPRRAPVFAYLHVMDPHAPYLRHPQYDELLPNDGAAPIEDWHKARYREGLTEVPPQTERNDSWRRLRANRGRYDREIRFTDEHIAQLFDGLAERGLLENAIVAFVADHGEVLWDRRNPNEMWAGDPPTLPRDVLHGEHGWFITQELIGTPFVLWGAGVPSGVRVETAVENLDLLPTLLELCDLPSPGGLHGESLVPLMNAPDDGLHEFVFSYVMQRACVREVASGWKLSLPEVEFVGRGVEPELYNLLRDPLERDNRYDAEPAVVERLTGVLDEWKRAHPIETTLGRALGADESADLKALGYLGDEEQTMGGAPGAGARGDGDGDD